MKSFKIILGVLAAATVFSTAYAADTDNKAIQMQEGVYLPQPRTDIMDFKLTDNHGKPFTRDNLKGHWTMMFFGFTNCGLVCPTTLAALRDMYKTLQKTLPADQLPQVVMVSVDPERDTVKRMNDYVTSFDPHFIGARADIDETVQLEKNLHIAAAKIESNGHYTINHSAEILLFNPLGQLQAFLTYPHHAPQMVKDYQDILVKHTVVVLKK
jgi:protein SCO1/2